jgi:hypothetical protein
MATESTSRKDDSKKSTGYRHSGASEAVCGFGLIGALVYYIGHAGTFWLGVLGFFKAIAWPAMLVYEVLKYLHM